MPQPLPHFQRHLTIIDKEHTPQSMKGRFEDMLHLAENLDEFYILYNGPECGASAPDHMHFQAAGKEEELTNPFALNFLKSILEMKRRNNLCRQCIHNLHRYDIRSES